jgi:HD-GYP domain-containing protein (c-di-GMP phosphodiesterase class II)
VATAATPSAQPASGLEAEVIEEQRVRRLARLAANERLSLAVSNILFVAAAVSLFALIPSDRSPSTLAVLLLVTAYAVAFHLDFEIGTGSAVPTQLILVPMFFVLPTGSVPLAVAGAIMLASVADAARGSLHFERVFLHLGNAWHAVGPALVLGLAGEGQPTLSRWPLYVAALAAQFAFDFVTAAAREWLVLGVPPKVQLKAMGIVYLIDAGLAPIGLAVAFAATESSNAVVLALPLVALLAVFSHERRGRINTELELRDAYRGTAFLLGDVVEADDAYTGAHSREVVDLTLAVVDELGLPPRERRDAEFAALLHDVGKVRIPNSIINKPGALTPEERAVIETHTIEGERMLHRVGGLLGNVGRTIRSCHERYDGTGYPDGVAGDQIPLVARIVACCDAFNAMTTDRAYRPALPQEQAVDELAKNSGTQFDPVVVEALIATIRRREDGISAEPISSASA